MVEINPGRQNISDSWLKIDINLTSK